MAKTGKFRIGFEVGSGAEVSAEPHHLFISGLTQRSGKTTSLEGFASRLDGFCIVIFRTGRGDIGFEGAEPVRPFYRERVDWQTVEGLISEHYHEKMRFYRGDIMKAVRGAKSLDDVHRNVKKRLEAARADSFVEKVLTELEQYLAEVIPVLRDLDTAEGLPVIRDGATYLVDLEQVPSSAQQLIIAATLDKVMEDCRGVIVVIPEAHRMGRLAWRSVERVAREGAKLRNLVWLDSQQVTGIGEAGTRVLRSVDLWMFGRQTYDLEKERVAKMIPGRKVKADDVHGLEIGQFYVVQYGEQVQKVYVQPAWMDETTARLVATGQVHPANLRGPERKVRQSEDTDMGFKEMWEREKRRADDLEQRLGKMEVSYSQDVKAAKASAVEHLLQAPPAKKPAIDITALEQALDEAEGVDLEVRQEQPSLTVKVHRPVVRTDDSTQRGKLAVLVAEGWFDVPRSTRDILGEAKARGFGNWVSGNSRVTFIKELRWFTEKAFLRNEGETYVALPMARKRVEVAEER